MIQHKYLVARKFILKLIKILEAVLTVVCHQNVWHLIMHLENYNISNQWKSDGTKNIP